MLFDRMDAGDLNKKLQELMPGLSVKVFRTYNASITLDRLLHEPSSSETVDARKADYDLANKEVSLQPARTLSWWLSTSLARVFLVSVNVLGRSENGIAHKYKKRGILIPGLSSHGKMQSPSNHRLIGKWRPFKAQFEYNSGSHNSVARNLQLH